MYPRSHFPPRLRLDVIPAVEVLRRVLPSPQMPSTLDVLLNSTQLTYPDLAAFSPGVVALSTV
jgi:hypothetical protein